MEVSLAIEGFSSAWVAFGALLWISCGLGTPERRPCFTAFSEHRCSMGMEMDKGGEDEGIDDENSGEGEDTDESEVDLPIWWLCIGLSFVALRMFEVNGELRLPYLGRLDCKCIPGCSCWLFCHICASERESCCRADKGCW